MKSKGNFFLTEFAHNGCDSILSLKFVPHDKKNLFMLCQKSSAAEFSLIKFNERDNAVREFSLRGISEPKFFSFDEHKVLFLLTCHGDMWRLDRHKAALSHFISISGAEFSGFEISWKCFLFSSPNGLYRMERRDPMKVSKISISSRAYKPIENPTHLFFLNKARTTLILVDKAAHQTRVLKLISSDWRKAEIVDEIKVEGDIRSVAKVRGEYDQIWYLQETGEKKFRIVKTKFLPFNNFTSFSSVYLLVFGLILFSAFLLIDPRELVWKSKKSV